MMKKVALVALMVFTAGATVGCSITPPSGEQASVVPQAPESRADKLAKQGFVVGEEQKSIVFPNQLDAWGYIDDRAVWVETRPRRYYLVTLSFPCNELAFTQSIGFKNRGSQLMKNDDLVVPGPPVRTCKIDQIYAMERDRAVAKAYKERNKK